MMATVGCCITRFWTGVETEGCLPECRQQLFFANHCSHLDSLTILSALSVPQRAMTFSVAARDYWERNPVRSFLARSFCRAVMIDRRCRRGLDPLAEVRQKLARGFSLIFYPEGTRGTGAVPGPFRSGFYHLARMFPEVQLVPTYLRNLDRIMPKGSCFPLPLKSVVCFGEPLRWEAGETKRQFLQRSHQSLVQLA